VYTGFTGAVTTTVARFAVVGRAVTITFDFSGTSNATTLTMTPPIAVTANYGLAAIAVFNNGASQTTPGRIDNAGGAGSALRLGLQMNAVGAFTNVNGMGATGEFVYAFCWSYFRCSSSAISSTT